MSTSVVKDAHTDGGDWHRLGKLRSSVVSDALDALGSRIHCMSAELRALSPSLSCVGRAVTLQTVPAVDRPPDAFLRELNAIDKLQPHDVLVADARGAQCAFWGELLSTAASARGAAGAIVDGWVRDVQQTCAMGFPVYSRGSSPYDSIGRLDLVSVNQPIVCGGVNVRPGDLIVADGDGVAVVPAALIGEVLQRAETKATEEERVRALYGSGRKASEVFKETGVL